MCVSVIVHACVLSPVMPACSDPGDPVSLAQFQVARSPVLSACIYSLTHSQTPRVNAPVILQLLLCLKCFFFKKNKIRGVYNFEFAPTLLFPSADAWMP